MSTYSSVTSGLFHPSSKRVSARNLSRDMDIRARGSPLRQPRGGYVIGFTLYAVWSVLRMLVFDYNLAPGGVQHSNIQRDQDTNKRLGWGG